VPSNLAVQNVHTNHELTNFSLGWHPQGFIARDVLNQIPTPNETGVYWVNDQAGAFNVHRSDGLGSLRADGTPSLGLNFQASKNAFLCEEYAYHVKVTDRERKNADSVLSLEQSRIRRATGILMSDLELRVATLLRTTGNYTGATTNFLTLSGANQWNNASYVSQPSGQQSNIIKRFMDAFEVIRANTGGYDPTHVIIPPAVERVMVNDPGLTQNQYYVQEGLLSKPRNLGATFLGLQVLRPRPMYTTSVENTATTTYTDVWGKDVILFYKGDSNTLDDLMFGALFLNQDWTVLSWRRDDLKSDFHEQSIIEDHRLVANQCGYLLQTAVA
jgi:hypothetical protein